MPYELRINKRVVGTFDTEAEANERARDAVRADADVEPEIIDTATGKPATPDSSTAQRDDLANKVGY